MSAEMSIYGTASLQWTLRVVNNTIVRLKRPLMLIAANAESEPKMQDAACCTNARYHESLLKAFNTSFGFEWDLGDVN
jgi:hypothetical protein